jgi:hypothetical protein
LFFPALNGRFKTLAPTQQKSELPDSTLSKSELLEATSSKIYTISCMTSSDLRLNPLKSRLAIVQKNPILGVGTGDWKDELVKKYIELKKSSRFIEQCMENKEPRKTFLLNSAHYLPRRL